MSTSIESNYDAPRGSVARNLHVQPHQSESLSPPMKENRLAETDSDLSQGMQQMAAVTKELRMLQELREDKVSLGKEFLQKEGYPSDKDLDGIADALLKDIFNE